ncbi:unnamed protein product [Amoebophrya sp. A120]|nr:unnamed protein product [Amoebophrya sp. A120]|eukprot:GSA120T00020795001.1
MKMFKLLAVLTCWCASQFFFTFTTLVVWGGTGGGPTLVAALGRRNEKAEQDTGGGQASLGGRSGPSIEYLAALHNSRYAPRRTRSETKMEEKIRLYTQTEQSSTSLSQEQQQGADSQVSKPKGEADVATGDHTRARHQNGGNAEVDAAPVPGSKASAEGKPLAPTTPGEVAGYKEHGTSASTSVGQQEHKDSPPSEATGENDLAAERENFLEVNPNSDSSTSEFKEQTQEAPGPKDSRSPAEKPLAPAAPSDAGRGYKDESSGSTAVAKEEQGGVVPSEATGAADLGAEQESFREVNPHSDRSGEFKKQTEKVPGPKDSPAEKPLAPAAPSEAGGSKHETSGSTAVAQPEHKDSAPSEANGGGDLPAERESFREVNPNRHSDVSAHPTGKPLAPATSSEEKGVGKEASAVEMIGAQACSPAGIHGDYSNKANLKKFWMPKCNDPYLLLTYLASQRDNPDRRSRAQDMGEILASTHALDEAIAEVLHPRQARDVQAAPPEGKGKRCMYMFFANSYGVKNDMAEAEYVTGIARKISALHGCAKWSATMELLESGAQYPQADGSEKDKRTKIQAIMNKHYENGYLVLPIPSFFDILHAQYDELMNQNAEGLMATLADSLQKILDAMPESMADMAKSIAVSEMPNMDADNSGDICVDEFTKALKELVIDRILSPVRSALAAVPLFGPSLSSLFATFYSSMSGELLVELDRQILDFIAYQKTLVMEENFRFFDEDGQELLKEIHAADEEEEFSPEGFLTYEALRKTLVRRIHKRAEERKTPTLPSPPQGDQGDVDVDSGDSGHHEYRPLSTEEGVDVRKYQAERILFQKSPEIRSLQEKQRQLELELETLQASADDRVRRELELIIDLEKETRTRYLPKTDSGPKVSTAGSSPNKLLWALAFGGPNGKCFVINWSSKKRSKLIEVLGKALGKQVADVFRKVLSQVKRKIPIERFANFAENVFSVIAGMGQTTEVVLRKKQELLEFSQKPLGDKLKIIAKRASGSSWTVRDVEMKMTATQKQPAETLDDDDSNASSTSTASPRSSSAGSPSFGLGRVLSLDGPPSAGPEKGKASLSS